jgi:hypothetical protein
MTHLLLVASALVVASAQVPLVFFNAPDEVELKSGYVRLLFNLTQGSVSLLQGSFAGQGNFSTSPNLAGDASAPVGFRRGAVAVVISGLPGGEISTSSYDRESPIPFKVISNGTNGAAAFSVVLSDSGSRISASVVFGLDTMNPRRLWLNSTTTATTAFQPTLVALSTSWTPPNTIGWYTGRGVRQGMSMSAGYIASQSLLSRTYVIGAMNECARFHIVATAVLCAALLLLCR